MRQQYPQYESALSVRSPVQSLDFKPDLDFLKKINQNMNLNEQRARPDGQERYVRAETPPGTSVKSEPQTAKKCEEVRQSDDDDVSRLIHESYQVPDPALASVDSSLSTIYVNDRVFDQPKKAIYGIQRV